MRKMVLFLLFPASVCFATPPTNINLSYNVEKGSLHVDADHPTQNLQKNFIRLMKVYVNDQEAGTYNYFRQQAYDKFSDDVQVSANVGDVIKADLFSSEGGELAQEMTVTASGSDSQQNAQETGDNTTSNTTVNNTNY